MPNIKHQVTDKNGRVHKRVNVSLNQGWMLAIASVLLLALGIASARSSELIPTAPSAAALRSYALMLVYDGVCNSILRPQSKDYVEKRMAQAIADERKAALESVRKTVGGARVTIGQWCDAIPPTLRSDIASLNERLAPPPEPAKPYEVCPSCAKLPPSGTVDPNAKSACLLPECGSRTMLDHILRSKYGWTDQ